MEGGWILALVVAMGFAAAYFCWPVLVRVWRREGEWYDYASLDAVAVAFLCGCAVIAAAALGGVYWLLSIFRLV